MLSVSNSIPEQGFSENKYILEGRKSLEEDTIQAIRLVKNFINLHGGSKLVPISSGMIRAAGKAHGRMAEDIKAKQALKQAVKRKHEVEKNASEQSKKKKSNDEKYKAELKKLEVRNT